MARAEVHVRLTELEPVKAALAELTRQLLDATARAERAEAAMRRLRRRVGSAATELLRREMQHAGHGRDGHLNEDDIAIIFAALDSTETVEAAPEAENGPALEGAEPSSNRVLIGVRSSAYAESEPGTYWERAVLARFAAGQSIDLKTVREQLGALLRTIPAVAPDAQHPPGADTGQTVTPAAVSAGQQAGPERSDEGPKESWWAPCRCDACEEQRAAGLPVDGEERK